jgi:signal transduction histidine kinase
VPQEELEARPGVFVDLIDEEDRHRFLQACESVMGGGVLAWGGRLHRPGRSDAVWIELRALVRLGNAGDCLADGIFDDVSVRKRFELELLASRAQLRELSGHLDNAKEQERATIAREIHDELGALLTAAKIELATLANQLPPECAELAAAALSSEALIDQAMDMSRRIARSLRPAVLDQGIVAAIEWQAREFSKRMGIACEVAVETEDIDIDPQRSTAVFRVLQEALTNIAKHARARHVNVELEIPSGNQVVLRVLDDGVGIAAKDVRKPSSFGIRGMRERAESLGGALQVGPARGGGTEVSLMIPLSRSTAPEAPEAPLMRSR